MRLFIGLTLPEEIRTRIQSAWMTVKSCPLGYRPIEPQNWHFTLAFLGEVSEENLAALEALIDNAVKRPPKGSFCFQEFTTFPPKNTLYLVAKAEPQPVGEWLAFIERLRDLTSVAAPQIDRKPWLPHISVSRAKRGRILIPWSEPFEPVIWTPTEIAIIQSELTPTGSHYTTRNVFPFNL